MENKQALRVSITVAILSVIFLVMTISYNFELNKSIEQKDKILNEVLIKDSLLQKSKKKYSEKIDKYVQDCQYVIDGKTVGSDELVKIMDKLYSTNQEKSDSLYLYMELYKMEAKNKDEMYKLALKLNPCYDSLQVYKSLASYVKKYYGITHKVYIQGNQLKISRPTNRADSAAAVFKYYKHTLSKDKDGNWVVAVPAK